MRPDGVIVPDWPAPATVRAVSTLRTGGVSRGRYASLNLGSHVGDAPGDVAVNRERLGEVLTLPQPPRWLRQVHGTELCVEPSLAATIEADAAVSRTPGCVLAILTADCLPVLIARRDAPAVGAAHAGWRGLAAGVLERTVAELADGHPEQLLAWLGPAIGPQAFEVGEDVRRAFLAADPGADTAFQAARRGHYLADLTALARRRLAALGVTRVFGDSDCTFSDPARFFSYRRDGACGRMATLIWLESPRR